MNKKPNPKPPRKHKREWADNTRTKRTDKRKAQLVLAAEVNKFETWSGMLTYIKNQALLGRAVVNNEAEIPQKER